MESEEQVDDESEPQHPRSLDDEARIYPLITDDGHQEGLEEWFRDHDEYQRVETSDLSAPAEFDLCLCDHASLEQHRRELEALKADTEPLMLPVLLLAAVPGDGDDGSEEFLNESWRTGVVDEIITQPIRSHELTIRVRSLLRLRKQSQQLSSQTERVHSQVTEFRLFCQAIENSGHAVYITDTEGTITYVNPAFTEITGYEPEQALGRKPDILSSGTMSATYYQQLWETLESGEVWEEEILNRTHAGEQYYAHQTISPVSVDGTVQNFVAVQTDITDRKELERELKRYRAVVLRLDDPIMFQNLDGEFELVNDAVVDFAGLPRTELLGRDEFSFMDETAAQEVADRKDEVLETGESVAYSIEPRFEFSEKQATFSTKRYPYYDGDGTLVGTSAICRNVTALKAREKELQRYKHAITEATDLIAAVDRTDRFLFANPTYCQYHGLNQDDVRGVPVTEALSEREYDDIRQYVEQVFGGESVQFRTVRSHPTRGQRTLDVHYYPLRDNERVTGMVAVCRDVTDSEERDRQLHVVDRVLRHDLRNALTTITLGTEQLERLDEQSTEITERVLRTVDDLLETTEKSREITAVLNADPVRESFEVGRVTRQVADAVNERYPNARVTVDGPEHVVVSASTRLGDGIVELVTNAIEHNDTDCPVVSITVDVSETHCTIDIADNGPGIPEMDRTVLTSGRVSDELSHESGLGLWLVYWIVRRSGGSIQVRERDPRGTSVCLQIPLTEE